MQHLVGKNIRVSETKKAFELHKYNDWETPISFHGSVVRVINGGEELSDEEIESLYYTNGNYDRKIFELFRIVKFNRIILNRKAPPMPDKIVIITVNPMLWEVTEL